VYGARAPVEGPLEIALASFPITGLQLRQRFAVDVNKTKIILLKGSCSLDRFRRGKRGPALEPLRLQNAPDAIAIEVREKVSNDKSKVIQSEVGNPAQRADHRAFFLGRFPRQLGRPGGRILAVLGTALPPLTDGLGTDTVALG
jgi:hypothetical protein